MACRGFELTGINTHNQESFYKDCWDYQASFVLHVCSNDKQAYKNSITGQLLPRHVPVPVYVYVKIRYYYTLLAKHWSVGKQNDTFKFS